MVEVKRRRLQAEIPTKGKGTAGGSVFRGLAEDCRGCESSSKGCTRSVIRKEEGTTRNLVVEEGAAGVHSTKEESKDEKG